MIIFAMRLACLEIQQKETWWKWEATWTLHEKLDCIPQRALHKTTELNSHTMNEKPINCCQYSSCLLNPLHNLFLFISTNHRNNSRWWKLIFSYHITIEINTYLGRGSKQYLKRVWMIVDKRNEQKYHYVVAI